MLGEQALLGEIDLVIEQDGAFGDDGLARRNPFEHHDPLIADCTRNHVAAHEAPRRVLHVGVLTGAIRYQGACCDLDAAFGRGGAKLHLGVRVRLETTVSVVEPHAHGHRVTLGIDDGGHHVDLAVDHDAGQRGDGDTRSYPGRYAV